MRGNPGHRTAAPPIQRSTHERFLLWMARSRPAMVSQDNFNNPGATPISSASFSNVALARGLER